MDISYVKVIDINYVNELCQSYVKVMSKLYCQIYIKVRSVLKGIFGKVMARYINAWSTQSTAAKRR